MRNPDEYQIIVRATRNALNMTRSPTHHDTRERERERERDKSALNFSRRVHPCGNPRKTYVREGGEEQKMMEERIRRWMKGPFCRCPFKFP